MEGVDGECRSDRLPPLVSMSGSDASTRGMCCVYLPYLDTNVVKPSASLGKSARL